jgi:DNA-binding CsgD family transcriptional regulator
MAAASGQDHTSLILRDERAGRWMALRVSIPHGFSRDVLAQQLAGEADSQRIAILEVAAAGGTPDPQALNALARAMGFAPAEEQLILALVLGQSAGEIAAARGSSLSTVRQRIKSVLAKAGCRRQSELVGLVRMLCGGAEQ